MKLSFKTRSAMPRIWDAKLYYEAGAQACAMTRKAFGQEWRQSCLPEGNRIRTLTMTNSNYGQTPIIVILSLTLLSR